MAEPLLQIEHLKTYFPVRKGLMNRTVGHVKAVDDISITIHEGETFGLVGESGSGKSTVGKSIVRLTEKQMDRFVFREWTFTACPCKRYGGFDPSSSLFFRTHTAPLIHESVLEMP